MATGTIKNQPSIIRATGSVTFTNGAGTYTNSNIKPTSFVIANRRISSYGIGVICTNPQDGKVNLVLNQDASFTSNIEFLIINDWLSVIFYMASGTIKTQSISITGQLPALGSNVYFSYPSGYTVNNCVVVGLMVELADRVWAASTYDGANQADAVLFETQIAVGAKSAQMANHNFRLILAKI